MCQEATKKSLVSQSPSLITPPLPPPLLTQSLPQPLPLLPSLGPSWSSPESEEGESKHRQGKQRDDHRHVLQTVYIIRIFF